MQSKTPLLMVTALVCGLGAAFGTWKLVSGAQAAPPEDTKVKVLVPVAEIPSYHLFQDAKRFTEMEIPKSKLRESEEDTITSFEQIKGKTSRHYKLRANEPVYKNDICESVDSDIGERLQPGEVAEGIPVSPEDGGGFIHVGDRVDIIATVQAQGGEGTKTLYILEGIEVLAVDGAAMRTELQPGQVTPPTRFLLRVTRPQGLVLRHFRDTSRLGIVKRRIDDKQILGPDWTFTMGKTKLNTVPRYQEESAEATQTVPVQEIKLADPVEEVARRDTTPQQPGVAKVEGPEWNELTERSKHSMRIDDSGTPRTIQTNEEIIRKRLELKKKEEEKKESDAKKNEKSNGNG